MTEQQKIKVNYRLFDDYKYVESFGYNVLGDIFYIDNDDIQKVLSYTWCIKDKKHNDYRLVSLTDGKMKFLHRIIMNIDDSKLKE